MDDSGDENITISDSIAYDFQRDLILYAQHPKRLLFIDNVEFWRDFHSENSEKDYEGTPEQLCEYFIQQVLPQMKNFNLNEKEENLLTLLDLQPGYHRTEDGYVKTDKMETIDLRRDCGKTLLNNHQHDEIPDDLAFANNRDLNCKVVITPHDAECQYAQHAYRELPTESAGLLSAVLCSDGDLPLCPLRTTDDIKNGLQEAKLLFEQTGQQPDNVNCSIEDLVAKLKTLCELKATIAELLYEHH